MGNSSQAKHPSASDTKEDYKFVKAIGRGGFGRVWKVVHKRSGHIFAMKVMSKARILTKKAVDSVMKERRLLLQINSPFVASVLVGFQDRTNLYSLMELMSGGDLRYHLNQRVRFSQEAVRFIILCLMKGLAHLHSMNIIHRDIKPENIIFDDKGYCKLIDLGIATQLTEDNSEHTSGTPGYMSPEVMCRQNHGFCADYYAVGIVAYELIIGRRPFVGKTRTQIRKQLMDRQFQLPDEEICSPQCANFVNKLIQRKVCKRLGFHGIDQILDHPWLNLSDKENRMLEDRKLEPKFVPSVEHENYWSCRNVSEETDQERQNALLLKNHEIQELFDGYNFMREVPGKVNPMPERTVTLPEVARNSILR